MKKFRYRMEPLLKQRKHVEDEKQKILSSAQKKILEQQDELAEINQSQKGVCDSQKERTQKPFLVAEMLIYSRFVHKLKRDTVVGTEMLKVLRQDEIKKRADLLKASQERKKYEKLKEIQQEKFNKEFEYEEKKESDEIALNIYRYKKSK